MTQTVISPAKANSLFWLGRYTERTYLQLHLLRRCFDQMIDGKPADYNSYLSAIGNSFSYDDLASERFSLVHDSRNPISILSCVERANDNALIIRDEITSPTLGYIQMSLEMLRHAEKEGRQPDIDELQTLTDWMLAFWGSVEERVYDERVRHLLKIGKLVEHIDMNIRFAYKFYRIEEAFDSLTKLYRAEPKAFNPDAFDGLKDAIRESEYDTEDPVYVNKVQVLLGSLVTV